MAGEEQPILSAIVFGYRDEATVLQAVGSLAAQVSDDPFEIIVATSGGDRTAELVRQTYPEVTVVESPTRLYPGGVRNLGLSVARGAIVAFLEADCVACPGWVANRIALHRAGHGAVAGAMADSRAGLAARAWLYSIHPARLVGHDPGPASFHQAYGLSLTREALERAGLFDDSVRSDEDTMMTARLLSCGIQPYFDPSVAIKHTGPHDLRAMVRDLYGRGQLDSWEETLALPPGRLRQRFERMRFVAGPFIVVRSFRRLPNRVRWIAVELHRGKPRLVRDFVPVVIPMVVGLLAHQLGWIVDQMRVRRPNQGERRGEVPVPSGLRRRVATTGDEVISLCFTGGPSSRTDDILDTLREAGVRAAFFVTATQAERYPEAVRRIVLEGHILGSSGWGDHAFTELSGPELEHEVTTANAAIAAVAGAPVEHVQPPFGAYSLSVEAVLRKMALQAWLWTSHGEASSDNVPDDGLVDATLDRLTPGAIVRLSEASSATAPEALHRLLESVRARGYRFVTLKEAPRDEAGSGPEGVARHDAAEPRSDAHRGRSFLGTRPSVLWLALRRAATRVMDKGLALTCAAGFVIAATDALERHLVLMGWLALVPALALLADRWWRVVIAWVWALALAIVVGIPDHIWGTARQMHWLALVGVVGLLATAGKLIVENRAPGRAR